MITGQITLQGFHFNIADGHGAKIVDGKETGGTVPVKLLAFRDARSDTQINIVMSLEAFDKFLETLQGSKIIPASFVPDPPHITRNGRLKS